jgi:hypothetical protein
VISHKNHFYHVICLLKTFSRSPLFIRCGIKSPLLGFKANSDTISILCFHKSTCLFPPSNPYSSIKHVSSTLKIGLVFRKTHKWLFYRLLFSILDKLSLSLSTIFCLYIPFGNWLGSATCMSVFFCLEPLLPLFKTLFNIGKHQI